MKLLKILNYFYLRHLYKISKLDRYRYLQRFKNSFFDLCYLQKVINMLKEIMYKRYNTQKYSKVVSELCILCKFFFIRM